MTATQFEFRLLDGPAPAGELKLDHLLALVQALKEIATKISRITTDAQQQGRPPARTGDVAQLSIGLVAGSTRLLVRRSAPDGALDFDVDDEVDFDWRFDEVVTGLAANTRPAWVSDSLAASVGDFSRAMGRAARSVEFSADGAHRARFRPSALDSDAWVATSTEELAAPITFVGRLRAVNLDSHRMQVTDDLGTKVKLPNVADDETIAPLLGRYVVVTGTPEFDADGRVAALVNVQIEAAQSLPASSGIMEAVPLEKILASAPGPEVGDIPGLTDEEIEAYFAAIGR